MSRAPPTSRTREAPGKLNLGLRVLGRRPDGYHRIDSLFLRLDLADELSVEPQGGAGGAASAQMDLLSRRMGDEPALDAEPLDLGPGNLVLRALAAYRRAAAAVGVSLPPLRWTLRKRLPWGAGLGGGSADAAAALRLAEEIAPAGLDLQALGLEIGSDLPFCLSGWPAARVGGRGEELEAVDLPPLWLVLLSPRVPVSAADAYRWWSEQPVEVPPMEETLAALRGERPWPTLLNALQPGVAGRVPAVAEALDRLQAHRVGAFAMSGSGSTCFLLVADRRQAQAAADGLRAAVPGWWLRVVRAGV